MAGTETGIKYLRRKLAALRKPDSDEGKITPTDASQTTGAQSRANFSHAFDSEEAKKASLDKRMDMWRDEKGLKKGGAVKASSASRRADGIARKGKTRGRLV